MASANLDFTQKVRFKQLHEEEDEDAQLSPPATDEDICRVCRTAGSPGRPLFHPCLCTGSIRFIHQDCLMQWLKHSGKDYCELCKHHFEFAPIYQQDMPQRLPVTDFISGVTRGTVKNLRHWFHLSFVAFMWLIIVPICIYRIYRFLLYGSLWSFTKFPLQLLSLDNLILDAIYGLVIVFVSLLAFICLVWLKDQLGTGRGPAWMENDRRVVHQIQRRHQQDQANVLRQHLEAAGQRARERQNAPDRLNITKELNELHEQLQGALQLLRMSQKRMFVDRLDELRLREMELTYDLGLSQLRFQLDLRNARDKRHNGWETWRDGILAEQVEQFRREVGDPAKMLIEVKGVGHLPRPTNEEVGMTKEQSAIIELVDRGPRNLTEEEKDGLRQELQELREEREVLNEQYERYQKKLCNLMSHQGAEESPEMEEIRIDEKTAIYRIRVLKKELNVAYEKEKVVVDRQNREERERRQQVEERMNRWYNRLLGRHQNDDPMVLARRRRRERQRQRLNIGQALAGLARDQPIDHAAGDNVEELTWARLLGLDGSFRFLEHVMWLICLNSALIIGFVYLPYQLGWFTAAAFRLWDLFGIVTWKGVISTFMGYMIASVVIMMFYYGTGLIKLPRLKNVLGITYISIKVGLILTVEAGIFPLMCGWWMDICSFALFGSTMKSRQASLESAPGTVMFLHWLAGMIFIFYLASFVMLLREVLRPGVLWFLRNLNDQNFHPIHEMIGLPFQRHLRRFIMSCIMFGVCVMAVLLIPSKLITFLFKGFLPFSLTLTSSVSPIREVQLELILLQFVIPTLLEHGNCRVGLKILVQHWVNLAASLFGLHSYLLDIVQTGGSLVDIHGNVIQEVPYDPAKKDPIYTGPQQVLGPGFAPFKPYLRPPYFFLRVTCFLLFASATAVLFSSLLLLVPISIGRFLMSLIGMSQSPEIYTVAIGLYGTWLAIKAANSLAHYVSQGTWIFIRQFGIWIIQGLKCVVAGFLLFVVIPLLLGHLVDLLLIIPLRVPADRTPVFYPSTEWALGLLHTKCMCGAIWLTNIQFKRTLDEVYQAGIRNLNLTFIVREVAWPVILNLSLCIAVPYITFMGALCRSGILSYENSLLLYRYCFPSMLCLIVAMAVLTFTVKQFTKIYRHIRNEKYLVGRQLVNYINLEEEETEQLEAMQETEQLGAVQQETVQQETEQLEAVQQETGQAAREMEYSVPVQETGEL